jgi:multisubunit Na+/H+ antiporter MnhB subunit
LSALALLFDSVLALALPVVAWRALASRTLFQGVVVFISFGLLLSLWWVRMGAIDVALAEAALGAGFTGALLLDALVRLRLRSALRAQARLWARALRLALVAGLAGALAAVLLGLQGPLQRPQGDKVASSLEATGVENPVTAVLLNFRAWDTLLEIAVVLMAAIGAWSLLPPGIPAPTRLRRAGPVLPALARVLIPIMVLVAAYILVTGTSTSGGAFQASALLAGAGVVLWAAGQKLPLHRDRPDLRAGLALGLVVFLGVAVGMMAAGRNLLQYPPRWAYALTLVIEVALLVSVALVLSVLFIGARLPQGEEEPG